MAVCPIGYPTIVSQARAWPRHMGVSCGRVSKLVCTPYFDTAQTHRRV
ncbi:hypothetical protein F383_33912 [Gossypium arboreum]|uniref:Uncharacterized protein n=1 Tax=Gossypium arboreum TaxID=29729 RepID=A0A0B0N8G8_GOSAR|nr:hypothetical protein F383_33912 [Gossypium arboreum]